jgi:hypothetical protein
MTEGQGTFRLSVKFFLVRPADSVGKVTRSTLRADSARPVRPEILAGRDISADSSGTAVHPIDDSGDGSSAGKKSIGRRFFC